MCREVTEGAGHHQHGGTETRGYWASQSRAGLRPASIHPAQNAARLLDDRMSNRPIGFFSVRLRISVVLSLVAVFAVLSVAAYTLRRPMDREQPPAAVSPSYA
jgi:hypothetical protein